MPDNFLCKPLHCSSADAPRSSATSSGSTSIYFSGGFSADNDVIEGGLVFEKRGLSGEWDDASESWADFVRGGKDYYRDEMNNPATFRLMGNVKNKRVLDLSCGEGYNSRLLAKRGAKVVGVDFSEKMIELAKQTERKEKLGIDYRVADATELKGFKNGSFDIVTCIMALMDIEHYEEAVSEAARVLKRNGRFVFSITHPCFEFGETVNGEIVGEWKNEEAVENMLKERALCLEVRNYFCKGKCEISWDMKRLVKPFKTTSFHRTLTDYFRALYENGFLVLRLVEPKPTSRGATKHPPLKKHIKIPHSIIIEAIRK